MVWFLIGAALLAFALALGMQVPAALTRSSDDEDEQAAVEEATRWAARVSEDLARSEAELAMITRDVRREWEEARPEATVPDSARKRLSPEAVQALDLQRTDLRALAEEHNGRVLRRALTERRHFVRTIEARPLTPEQALAVSAVDNRVQVVAAAGSGKTSVMVARAAWAVKFGGLDPSEVLLLAFNRFAADELRERVADRFTHAGIDPSGVRVSTFDNLGLEIIAQATGHRPRLATWINRGEDVATLTRIADRLRATDAHFRHRWELFRLLFAPTTESDADATPDAQDPATGRNGWATMRGEVVRSQSDRLLANWLFLNGVEYGYEDAYEHDVPAPDGSRYRPTFHYPEIDAWHEHWALDDDARPHPGYLRYAETMTWRRGTHRQHETTLVETTWAEIARTHGFAPLAEQLTALGLTLSWRPERAGDDVPVRHEDLARLVRTFMSHVKSSGLSREQVDDAWRNAGRSYRTRLFLDLYWPLHEAWQEWLDTDAAVDFEDMLLEAATHVEEGTDLGVRMVLVDEFQDTSPARARLVRALVAAPHRYLMTVGDDWQAINRSAGADLSVMTDFERWFGEGRTLALQTTFRTPRAITEAASEFVQQNPRQIRKQVRTHRAQPGTPILLVRLGDESELAGAVQGWLEELSRKVFKGTVLVLGRHETDEALVPRDVPTNLEVTFRTIRGSKGSEADHVLVPRMLTGRDGFPSDVADDPVLELVTSRADAFPHGEERRLFYVAMTRAKRSVSLMTVAGKESPFVTELVERGRIEDSALSTADEIVPCPACGEGSLVPRSGPDSGFLGCSTFPTCRHTEQRRSRPRPGSTSRAWGPRPGGASPRR